MGALKNLIQGAIKAITAQFTSDLDAIIKEHNDSGKRGKDGKPLPPLSPDYVERIMEVVEVSVERRIEAQTNQVYNLEETTFINLCEQGNIDPEDALDFYDEHEVVQEYDEADLRDESSRLSKETLGKVLSAAKTEISIALTETKLEEFVTQTLSETKLEVEPFWYIDDKHVEESQIASTVLAWLEGGE